jgi:hypothetical protein
MNGAARSARVPCRLARIAALIVSGCASVAHAHTPLARDIAVESASGAVAVRMPGFGWLLRGPTADSAPANAAGFAYACDALIGVSGAEEHTPMAYRSDGSLLVGTAHGLRMFTPERCPASESALAGRSVVALAVHATQRERVYAITQAVDLPPAVQRSDDGGASWTLAAQLAARPVTALVLDPSDPQVLYVSQTLDMRRASIAVSHDGGATFETFEHDRALTLVYAQSDPLRLWATARVPDAPAGVAVLRAERAAGPWQEPLTVNFFGGLAVDPSAANVIWVGDEARGVFRSSDGGDRFDEVQPSIASACLTYGAGALWSCTPALPTGTAVLRSPDAFEPFLPVLSLAEIDEQVECGGALDVEQVCAPAWREWQRDVLAPPDAGMPALQDAGAAALGDAAEPPAIMNHATSCAAIPGRASSRVGWCTLAALALLARRVRRRPTRRTAVAARSPLTSA